MHHRSLALFALTLALPLSACGGVQRLSQPRNPLAVPAATGAAAPQTPAEMIEPSTQAVPNRQAEPLLRSQERPEDPFNLPPSG